MYTGPYMVHEVSVQHGTREAYLPTNRDREAYIQGVYPPRYPGRHIREVYLFQDPPRRHIRHPGCVILSLSASWVCYIPPASLPGCVISLLLASLGVNNLLPASLGVNNLLPASLGV